MKMQIRKFMAVFLALCMTIGTWNGIIPVFAANVGLNAYNHTAVYTPVTSLYTRAANGNLQPFKLFDASCSEWNNSNHIKNDRPKVKEWLVANSYLLNKFGTLNTGTTSTHWLNKFRSSYSDFTSGNIPNVNGDWSYEVQYNFSELSSPSSGNMRNMLNDIEYFFTANVKTTKVVLGIWRDNAYLSMLGKSKNFDGNQWHDVNWSSKTGPIFEWRSGASNLSSLIFKGDTNLDKNCDARLESGMLVGRDIKGPEIKSVKITTDQAGYNQIPGGAINLNTIDSFLTDRTVYFQVTWSEPVQFKNLSDSDIAKLLLRVNVEGVDKSSGTPIDAPFLSFTPSSTDSTPVMTFEYKIFDPYDPNSSVGLQDQAPFYLKFVKININSSENKALWNNLYDIAGNKFSANKDANQSPRTADIDGAPFVDLRPFAIEDISLSKDKSPDPFVEQGELLSVKLELNKLFAPNTLGTYSTTGANFGNLPSITLNVKDPMGNYVIISPTNPSLVANYLVKKEPKDGLWVETNLKQYWQGKPWPLSAVGVSEEKRNGQYVNIVTYNVQLYPGYTLDDDKIRVTAVDSPVGAKDAAGYTLMNYAFVGDMLKPTNLHTAAKVMESKYFKSLKQQYKLDYIPPDVEVFVNDETNGVIGVRAKITDDNLKGGDATVDITVEGNVNGMMKYQSTGSYAYSGSQWADVSENTTSISVRAPVEPTYGTERNAYAFIKLPVNAEVSSVSAKVTIADEPGNIGTGSGALPPPGGSWIGYDTYPPRVELSKNGETADVSITDLNPVAFTYYQWQDTFESNGTTRKTEPGTYTIKTGSIDTIDYTDILPEGNTVHYRTLWVKAEDNRHNISAPVSMDFAFVRTYAEIRIDSATNTGMLRAGDLVSATVTLENVSRVWYMWLEKPANFVSPYDNIDYGDAASYLMSRGFDLVGAGGSTADWLNSWNTQDRNNKFEMTVPDSKEDENAYTNKTTMNITLNQTNGNVVKSCADYYADRSPDNKWSFDKYGSVDFNGTPVMIPAYESTRPLVLLIAVEDPEIVNGTTKDKLRFASIDYDTYFAPPEIPVKQVRFSTNDLNGERIDHIRKVNNDFKLDDGLYWPNDTPTYGDIMLMANVSVIKDFGEAEFYIGADPVTGLDRVDFDRDNKIQLQKVLYRGKTKQQQSGELGESLCFDDAAIKSRTVVQEWDIKKENLTKPVLYGGYSITGIGNDFAVDTTAYRLIVSIEPSRINAMPYEVLCDEKGNQEIWFVRYEFVSLIQYLDKTDSTMQTVSYFIFNNSAPTGSLSAITSIDADGSHSYIRSFADNEAPGETAAVFEINGVSFSDITGNIPLITYGKYCGEDDLGYYGEASPGVLFDLYHGDGNGYWEGDSYIRFNPNYPLIVAARDQGVNELNARIAAIRALVVTIVELVNVGDKSDAQKRIMLYYVDYFNQLMGKNFVSYDFASDTLSCTADELNNIVAVGLEALRNVSVGSQPAVRWGGAEQLEVNNGRVKFKDSASGEEFTPERESYIKPVGGPTGMRFDEFDSHTLYYQFYDILTGAESPICVFSLRRDETPPVVSLSVSDTENPVSEVSVRIDSIYDMHPETDAEGITSYIIDTPSEDIRFEANFWRMVDPRETFNTTNDKSDDYYNEHLDFWTDWSEYTASDPTKGIQYVRVKPDENGVYRFIRNGFIEFEAADSANNETKDLLINGVETETQSKVFGISTIFKQGRRYNISNIDCDPPEFTTEPVWNEAQGRFTVSGSVDETAVGAYLRFDKDYSELLTGVSFDGQESGSLPVYSIADVPGLFSGEFDTKSGEIDAEFYVKFGEGKTLKEATLIVVDEVGNAAERTFAFSEGGLPGTEPRITNASIGVESNVNDYPVYNFGETLNFSVPARLEMLPGTDFAMSHGSLPIYEDGIVQVVYSDLFGGLYMEYVYASIFGPGFAHNVKFFTGSDEFEPSVMGAPRFTNQDIIVKIDTAITAGLTVEGRTEWQTTVTENGSVTYTLSNSNLSQSKTFTIPVICIDRTIPEAVVSTVINSWVNEETGETLIFSITYNIIGFNKNGVTVIDDHDQSAPICVTFDRGSESKIYTFKFRDSAGNVGTYTADVSDITFSDPLDAQIAGYRLTYSSSGDNGSKWLGVFTSDDESVDIEAVNSNVVVRVEALNESGEPVSAVMSLIGSAPSGVTIFTAQKSVLFTLESDSDQTVTVNLTGQGAINVPIVVPGGTIDKTAPTGTVIYVPTDESVKAYLLHDNTDLAENGVSFTGQDQDGRALELKNDSLGYYVEFTLNGFGYFIMRDHVGNIGTVAVAVITIDREPPVLGAELWSSVTEASSRSDTWLSDLETLLSTPTNNSIKLFFSFNKQLSKAEVNAYDNKTALNELLPTELFVTAIAISNTVTVEFKQNCIAKIVVFDVSGNQTVLWRPENSPITVIDKIMPELEDDYPKTVFADNKVVVTYKFKNNKEVLLTSDDKRVYKNVHVVEFTKNGQSILTFMDKAGNVANFNHVVTQIDDLEPYIRMNLQFVGEGSEVSVTDADGNEFIYTNRNVWIVLNVTDDTPEGLTVTAARLGGTDIAVTTENITVDGNDYTHHFTIEENGVYMIKATDKWGQSNIIYPNFSMIDTAAPVITMESTKAVISEKNADTETVKNELLQGVTAVDVQSGRNGGVTLTVDISGVDLAAEGSYTATITAADRLGNKAVKTRIINVLGDDLRLFFINGQPVVTNDVFVTIPAQITVSTSHKSFGGEKINLYYAEGYKTIAQMKYATPFIGAEGFNANAKGYYSVLAQSAERGMFIVYVYIF